MSDMTLMEYQKQAESTAIYPGAHTLDGLMYAALGLTGESGEISNKVKKILRDNHGRVTPEIIADLAKELGDVLWYVAILAYELGLPLEEVAQLNIEKLRKRAEDGKLKGSGDTR